MDANSAAQQLRRDGRLADAQRQLVVCTDSACPSVVHNDCLKRMDELMTAQPTIVFEVIDASGANVSDVTVSDGIKPLASHLSGTALPVDIGDHLFTLKPAGALPITRKVFVTEGEKGRRERFFLPGGGSTPPASLATTSVKTPAPPPQVMAGQKKGSMKADPATPDAAPPMSGKRIAGLVLGVAGVAAVGVGSVFGLLTIAQENDQKNACASPTNCLRPGDAQSAHSRGMTDSAISTTGFAAGGALVLTGAILLLTKDSQSDQRAASAWTIAPNVGPDFGGCFLRGEF